jgi:cytochrome P450 / NADPH-cytochrome P450 reductase
LRTDRPPAFANRPASAAPPAAGATAAEPTGRVRLGHDTPLLILFGSNLGKAEELARQVADLAQVNGFATALGPLDHFVDKLPGVGGVLILCASYNGAPPDNASRFVEWLESDQPADALANTRSAVFGCGNRDWTATYQTESLELVGIEEILVGPPAAGTAAIRILAMRYSRLGTGRDEQAPYRSH